MTRGRDRGSAPVEFTLVVGLLLLLVLGVFQVAVYAHVRNVVVASAAEGARLGAAANRSPTDGAQRAHALVASTLSRDIADRRLRFTARYVRGPGDAVLVEVRAQGQLPVFFSPVGLLPLNVAAHALQEPP